MKFSPKGTIYFLVRDLAFELDSLRPSYRARHLDLGRVHELNLPSEFANVGEFVSKLIRYFSSANNFDLSSAQHLASAFECASNLARAFARARNLQGALDNARHFARSPALVSSIEADLDLVISRGYKLAQKLDLALSRNLPSKTGKMKKYLNNAQKFIQIIAKELKQLWPKSSWEQELSLEILGALTEALVVFIDELRGNILKSISDTLRQPGLLTPVNEFPPNSLGICGLVGNVWEWTSTTNNKGEHLICGGAWTEEIFNPDREEWRPPEWRDINLGFCCVCDWDKIFDVKTPEEISESPEGSGKSSE